MKIGTINLVIIATPRSGTTYMANLLNACGLRTFHQHYFNPQTQRTAWRYDGPYAEVSPAAYALRHAIPKRSIVLHQIRNPVDCTNSLLHTGHCTWNANHTPRNAWDKMYAHSLHGIQLEGTREQRCLQFWHAYNKRMMEYASIHKGYTYRIEDVSTDSILEIFNRLKITPDRDRIENAVSTIRKTINRLGTEPAQKVNWSDLTQSQKSFAATVGYRHL